MRKELSDYLIKKYPKIYTGCEENRPFALFGFECDDGWYNILDTLCRQIQHHIDFNKRRKEVGVDLEDIPQVVAEQVKEKFGSLRFYYYGGDEYISGLVSMAEAMSTCTCMTCGKPGTMIKDGWWHVACGEHN